MEPLGINTGLLLVQMVPVLLVIVPIITLIDLAKKKMSGTPLAVWVLIICAVPLLGVLAYWIIKPVPKDEI
jgi:Phospholipase_D-nuclease N-terminal